MRPCSTSTALISSWVDGRPGRAPCRRRCSSASAGARSSRRGCARRSCTTTSARREQLGAAHGEQPGIAGPGAHEVHGHRVRFHREVEQTARPPRRRADRRADRAPRRSSGSAPAATRSRSTVRAVERREQRVDHDRAVARRRARSAPHGQVAAAAELGEERPLGVDRAVRGRRRRSRRARATVRVVVGAALDRDRALPDLRAASPTGRARSATRSREPEPLERDGATTTASNSLGLARARVADVAAQLAEREVGAQRGELRAPAHRAGRDARARAGVRRACAPTSASRASPRSGTAASTRPSGVSDGGQVLGRVHREVGAPSSTASCTSFTNTPVPPSACSGACGRRSPVVVTITSSASHRSTHRGATRRARPASGPARSTRGHAERRGISRGDPRRRVSGSPKSSTSASAYSSPRAVPAASFSRTVGSCSSLLTSPG